MSDNQQRAIFIFPATPNTPESAAICAVSLPPPALSTSRRVMCSATI